MKEDSAYAKKFTALMKKICKAHKSVDVLQLEPTTQLIISFMEWNTTHAMALEAHDTLMKVMVDNNDVRVSLPQEIIHFIGDDYPLAYERASRMHESLNELFNREHDIVITSLKGKNKKHIKTYFETLPGVTPYVIAQMMLLAYGAHAIPVDNHMLALLKDEQVVHPDCTLAEAESFCERHIKATDALHTHLAMRAWADEYELMIPEMTPFTFAAPQIKLSEPKKTSKTKKASSATKSKTTKASKASSRKTKTVKKVVAKKTASKSTSKKKPKVK